MALDLNKVRSLFPSLAKENPYIYADNAGGSQCSQPVIDRIVDYLSRTNVQLRADYEVSQVSTNRVDEGRDAAKVLFNASSLDEIVLGSSSTMSLDNLSRAVESDFLDGEEIIITGEHEANNGCWKKLAKRRGLVVKYWHVTPVPGSNNPYAVEHDVKNLVPLINSKTRLVTISACSNLLGSIIDVKSVTQAIRKAAGEHGARKVEVSVDCVAYAPHRRMDVRDWDIDYCVTSLYKVYGPHISALYVRHSAISSLVPLTHHFLSPEADTTTLKLMPGGPGYELSYSVTGVLQYLLSISPKNPTNTINAFTYTSLETIKTLDDTFNAITEHEHKLIGRLFAFLKSPEAQARGVRIFGQEGEGPERVPTISFVVVDGEKGKAMRSRDVVGVFDRKGGIGIRYGHFYAYTLVEKFTPKIDPADSVVRISLVHYNTLEEVDKIVEVLKEALGI